MIKNIVILVFVCAFAYILFGIKSNTTKLSTSDTYYTVKETKDSLILEPLWITSVEEYNSIDVEKLEKLFNKKIKLVPYVSN